MSRFELDDGAVAQTEELLRTTGEAVDAEARRAQEMIVGLSGAGWQGGAMTTAVNKQVGEFQPAMQRLHNEINQISQALGLGRQSTMAEDANSEQALRAVPVELGNMGRL